MKSASGISAPLVVDVEEAAFLLGIGITKVYDLMRSRELPPVKIGRCTRIELAAIQEYIDQQRIGGAARIPARRNKHAKTTR